MRFIPYKSELKGKTGVHKRADKCILTREKISKFKKKKAQMWPKFIQG